MTATRTARDTKGTERAGTIALALGVLALAATVYTYVLSLSEDVNPPDWLRIAGLVWLPLGFFGTPVAYALARNGAGRHRAQIGLALAGLGLLAFGALLFIAG